IMIPIKAGIVQTSKDHCHPNCKPSAKGILTPEAIVASKTIHVVYTLVMTATLSGNFYYITLGSNTLQMAIPSPINNVPINKKATIEIERNPIPAISTVNPIIKAHAFVTFLPNRGARGDIMAKAINGKLVRSATLQFENPTSSLMVPSRGPTDVIAGRKLNAMRITPKTGRI